MPSAAAAAVCVLSASSPGAGGGSALAAQVNDAPPLSVRSEMGFAAARIEALDAYGWDVRVMGDSATVRPPDGPEVRLWAGTPFVESEGRALQLGEQ